MKKSFLLLGLMVVMLTGFAQSRTNNIDLRVFQSVDTSLNADTVIVAFNAIGSHLKGLQTSVYKLSGADTGIVYVQYTINGSDWVTFDSVAINSEAAKTKFSPITSTSGYSYRAWYKSTGAQAQTSVLSFAYLLRKDE